MPAMSVSASRDKDRNVHVSIVNAHAKEAVNLACTLEDVEASIVSGRILTSDELDAHNTFDEPDRVKPVAFAGASLDGDKLTAEIPPRSVVVLRLAK
jgi:alpha-N-arabinofuranosidase